MKKPLGEKATQIQELLAQRKRYYPVDGRGNIDEWGAVVAQQVATSQREEQQRKLQERQKVRDYGEALRLELSLRSKARDAELREAADDRALANWKKAEHDQALEQGRLRREELKERLAEEYETHVAMRRLDSQAQRALALQEG